MKGILSVVAVTITCILLDAVEARAQLIPATPEWRLNEWHPTRIEKMTKAEIADLKRAATAVQAAQTAEYEAKSRIAAAHKMRGWEVSGSIRGLGAGYNDEIVFNGDYIELLGYAGTVPVTGLQVQVGPYVAPPARVHEEPKP